MLAVPLTDYYEEVRRYLTCPEEVKDDLIYDVNRKVMDLNADRPDLDYDDVVDFLGDPEDLAQSLLDNIEEEAILAYQAHQKRSRLLRKEGRYSCCNCSFIDFSSLSYRLKNRCSCCTK